MLLDEAHLVLSSDEFYQNCDLQVYCYSPTPSERADTSHDDTGTASEDEILDDTEDSDAQSDGIYIDDDDDTDPSHLFTFRMPDPRFGRWPRCNLRILDIRATFPAMPPVRAPFVQDRSSTILSVTFRVANKHGEKQSSFVLLIPLSIFRTHIDRVLDSIACGHGRGVRSNRYVPWSEWATGTLLLTQLHPPSGEPPLTDPSAVCIPYGSRYPYLLCDSQDATCGDVLIFDLSPGVAQRTPSTCGDPESDSEVEKIVADPEPLTTTQPMQMHAPFAAYRKFHVEFPENARPTHAIMNHDGFSVVVRNHLSCSRCLVC